MTTQTDGQLDQAGRVGVRSAFLDASMPVKVVLVGVLINRLGGFLNLFLVLYLTAKGYSAEQAAAALSAYGAGAVVGVLIGGTLASRLGPRNATVISMTGTFLIMGSWLYLPSYPVLLLAETLVALISQIYRPASATLLSDLTTDDRQVMTFALYRFGLNLGATAAPLLGLGLLLMTISPLTRRTLASRSSWGRVECRSSSPSSVVVFAPSGRGRPRGANTPSATRRSTSFTRRRRASTS